MTATGRSNAVAVAPRHPGYQSYLLTGHLDGTPLFGRLSRDPWDSWIENGWLYGPESTDMNINTRIVGASPPPSTALPTNSFITDMADLPRTGIPIVLYGPGDWNTTPDEGVSVKDLITTAQVRSQLAMEIVSSSLPRVKN